MSRHNGLNPESIHFYIYEEDSKGNSRKNSSSSFFDSAINGADARARSFADVICTCSCWSSISLFVVAIHFVFSWLDCIEWIFLPSIIPERTRWVQSAVEKVFVLCFDVATQNTKNNSQTNDKAYRIHPHHGSTFRTNGFYIMDASSVSGRAGASRPCQKTRQPPLHFFPSSLCVFFV